MVTLLGQSAFVSARLRYSRTSNDHPANETTTWPDGQIMPHSQTWTKHVEKCGCFTWKKCNHVFGNTQSIQFVSLWPGLPVDQLIHITAWSLPHVGHWAVIIKVFLGWDPKEWQPSHHLPITGTLISISTTLKTDHCWSSLTTICLYNHHKPVFTTVSLLNPVAIISYH